MWHEARKQERKIRGMLVDYRKRAERRQDFYEKIKADPTQFMQVHGRKCKIHLDPAIAAAGDSPAIMMPWLGQSDNLIDRFDVRAHLDYIQPPPKVVIDENEEISTEERQCNYERYRILAQNDFLTISEEKYLHQLYLEEQFGVNAQIETEKIQAKKKIGVGAAIGYTYEDSDQIPFNQTMQHIQQNTLMINNPQQHQQQQSQMSQQQDKNDSDSDLDVDVPIDISKLDTSQAHELNGCGRNYGMKSNDFYSFLTKDADEADALRMAKEEEIEKNMYSGRKSRRERRAQREKRFIGRHISPPSYAAKEEPVQKTEENNDSDSRSPSPINSGKITYITSFGAEDELPPHSKISINFNKSQKPLNSTLGAEILNTTADAKRPLTYAEKVKQNLEKLKTLNNMAGAGNGNGNNPTTVIEISKKPIQYQRRSFSGSRSRSRSRPRRNDVSFNSRKRRNRSRTRSSSRSRSYNRRKSDSRSPIRHRSSNVRNSCRSNSRSKSRTRPRRKSRSRSRSRSYSNAKPSARTHRKYSTSSTSSSSSTTSVSSSSSSSSITSSTSSKSKKSKAIKSNRLSIKARTKSSSSGTSSRSSSSSSSSSRSNSLQKKNLKKKLKTPKRSVSSESRDCSPIVKKTASTPSGRIQNSNAATVAEVLIPDPTLIVATASEAVAAPINLNPLPEIKEKEVTIKMESPPIKRYYGRKRDDATSSDEDDLSDDDDDEEDNNSNEPVNTPTNSLDVYGLNFATTNPGNSNNNNFGQTTIQPLINTLGCVQGATIGSTIVTAPIAPQIPAVTSAVTPGTLTTIQSALITPTTSVGINFYPNINNNLNLNNNSMLGKTSTATSETKGGGNGNFNFNNNLMGTAASSVVTSSVTTATAVAGATVTAAGTAPTLKTFNKFNPRDRLKRKMQILLNKQYKADKKAEIERTERQIQQQQEREDEMRELALKLRRRQRELRHKYGTPTSSSRSPESKSGIILSGDESDLISNSLIAQQQLQLQLQQQQQQQNEIKNNLSKETIDKLQKKISSRSSRSKSRSTSATNDCHQRDNSNYQYGNGDRREKDYRDNRDSKYRDNDYRNRDYRYKNNSNKDSTRSGNSSNSNNINNNSSSSYRDRDRDRERDRRSNSRERRYKRSNDRTGSAASSSRSTNTGTTVRRLVDY